MKSSLSALIAVFALVALGLAPASAQDVNDPPPSAGSIRPLVEFTPRDVQPELSQPDVAANYMIGAGDLLSVFVYQMPEFSSQVRVSQNGAIRLPFLHAEFKASDTTPQALALEIQRQLVAQGLAVRPEVEVIVREIRSKPIVVTGAVAKPMVLQANRPMSLLEVLSTAGGLNDDTQHQPAGDRIYILHRLPGGEDSTEIIPTTLVLDGTKAASIMLYGNDTVEVPPARMVYTVGALQQPGAFPLRAAQPISVLNALSLSQGFSRQKPADKKHGEIIRTDAKGVRHQLPVNLDRILKHKDSDVPLLAGDILYVPEDGKRLALTTILADVGQAATIAVGYRAPI
jgi:polysaccharide export outer membrane protein